ncbi:MAG TPA: hypothetical protein VHY18_08810 [Solirubrobacteraceae bacterium]|nr:hypothetical protein [Solirubrobacteraceae bacterium]
MRLVAEIALVALAAGAIAVCLSRLPASAAPFWRRASRPEPIRPEQLIAVERLVSISEASALSVHAHLRPILVEICAQRLAARGDRLDAMTDEAGAEILGERLWELVRPGRPFPEDRHGPGIPARELAPMLGVIEQL